MGLEVHQSPRRLFVLVGGLPDGEDAAIDRVQLGGRCRTRDARLQSADRRVEKRPAPARRFPLTRDEHVAPLFEGASGAGQHADDREGTAVDFDRGADDLRIPTEPAAPETVGQDRRGGAAHARVLLHEVAPQGWSDADNAEVGRRDLGGDHPFRHSPVRERHGSCRVRGDAFEVGLLGLEGEVIDE